MATFPDKPLSGAPAPLPSLPDLGLSLEELLASVPLHSIQKIRYLYRVNGDARTLAWPKEYRDYCPSEQCQGTRRHSLRSSKAYESENLGDFNYGEYVCEDCHQGWKMLGLRTIKHAGKSSGECTKIFQEPTFGAPIPKRLFQMLGEENRDNFLNARRSIARGLGIGAYAYYRRIIENNKLHLVDSILDVAEKTGAPAAQIAALKAAAQERQFSKAITLLKDVNAIPAALLINGHNPLLLLHDSLSEGIHALDDSECLARSIDAETVLNELARLLQTAITERKEVHEALKNIMSRQTRST